MQKTSVTTKRGILCAAALFVLAGFLRIPERLGPPLVTAALFLTINLIYMGLIIVWGVSIRQRLQQGSVRRSLITVCALMVFWILLRACKYRYFEPIDVVLRYLWYGYYIPQLFGPVLVLLAALCLGRSETYRPAKAWYLLFVPSIALCALIMTNDAHQLAFRFQPGFADWSGAYAHGCVYYLSMIWLLGLLLSSFCILLAKYQSSGRGRRAWIPAIIFASGFVLCLLSFAGVIWVYQLPELFCATYAAASEACIRVCLVPSNENYQGFFSVSSIAARITDASGHTRFCAKGAAVLTNTEMRRAQKNPVMLDADTRLHEQPINGGHVYWLSNIATINRINDELAEARALLTEEVEIARAESEIKAQKARLEEQMRVYDHIALIARPQLVKLERLLSGSETEESGYENTLKMACILGAYIKRRQNLQFIAESAAYMQTIELYYCLRESAEYLSVSGVLCECIQDSDGTAESCALLLAYDFFQAAIEAALPTLSSLLIRCGARNDRLEMRLVMEDAASTVAPDWRKEELTATGGAFGRQLSDGTLFYTFHVQKAGDIS